MEKKRLTQKRIDALKTNNYLPVHLQRDGLYDNYVNMRATRQDFNVDIETYDDYKISTYFVTVETDGRISQIRYNPGSETKTPDQPREYLSKAAFQVTPDDG